jgi:hypothetical protein
MAKAEKRTTKKDPIPAGQRRRDGTFKPGHKKIGGIQKGDKVPGGRRAALGLLDQVLAEEPVRKKMRQALRAYIMSNPVMAFKSLVIPLLPKETIVQVGGEIDEKVPIRVLWGEGTHAGID